MRGAELSGDVVGGGNRHWRWPNALPLKRHRTSVAAENTTTAAPASTNPNLKGCTKHPAKRNTHKLLLGATLALTLVAPGAIGGYGSAAVAATAEDLSRDSAQALQTLYKVNPTAETISKRAKAKLVFRKIIKAGLVFGGSYGEGVVMKNGAVTEYLNSVSRSWGWQAGAESYTYVEFLMSDKAVNYLATSKGWERGVGPSVVVVDAGVTRNLATSTLKDDAYAFITDQQGLMASLSIEGTKISRIKKR